MVAAHDCEEGAGLSGPPFFAPARIKACRQPSGLADRTGPRETAADPTARGGRIGAAAFGDDGKHRFLNISGATH